MNIMVMIQVGGLLKCKAIIADQPAGLKVAGTQTREVIAAMPRWVGFWIADAGRCKTKTNALGFWVHLEYDDILVTCWDPVSKVEIAYKPDASWLVVLTQPDQVGFF